MDSESIAEQQAQLNPNLAKDRQLLIDARRKGPLSTLRAYIKLSGPGWLQGATTLGGGSLSSSLYLGVLAGFSLLWLQPLAMIMGIIMLSGIAYVTLSTGKRPFRAINEHVNPVLGWGWLIASMMANLVWSMPQFALGTAAVQQNLFKDFIGTDIIPDPWGKIIIGIIILTVCITVVLFYSRGGWGVKLFEIIIKSMVSMVVLCFFGVVIKITIEGALDWSAVLNGLVPNFKMLFSPAKTFLPVLEEIDWQFRPFWTDLIVSQQRDVIISAASTAVGINMTFLLPYSMLRKGWDKHFRGQAIFDLSTGLFLPFILATGCVIIASASQFHTTPAPGFLSEVDTEGNPVTPAPNLVGPYNRLITSRLEYEIGADVLSCLSGQEKAAAVESVPEVEKKIAAMLVKRDAFNLADALAPLTGTVFSQYVFGFGVLGMALGAITMLMLINGFVICEMFNLPPRGTVHKIGCVLVSVGVLGPFFWNDAKLWLAIPTSVFTMVLLPIAYFTFCLLMNQKKLLGENMPRGSKRFFWNILMALSAAFAALGSLWTLWSKLKYLGIAIFAAFIFLVLIVGLFRKKRTIS
jgi:Mn2+/Fe2+ NRAMP family transporter